VSQGVVAGVGRVTGKIAPGTIGEASFPLSGGGSSLFAAHPADGESTYPLGTLVESVQVVGGVAYVRRAAFHG
jgi:hypothetical protein